MRRLSIVVGLALAIATVTGCSVERTQPLPTCTETGVILIAQALTDAAFVPCLEKAPERWQATSVRIDQAGARIVFDPRSGEVTGATMEFRRVCAIGDSVEGPSPVAGVSRLDGVTDTAVRWYVFDGGCVRVEHEGGDPSDADETLTSSLRFLDRSDLERSFRDAFVDEDL